MPKSWLEFLSDSDVQAIHDTSMKLMGDVGIVIPEDEALAIFKHKGFKVEGKKVFF